MAQFLNNIIQRKRWVACILAFAALACYVWILPASFKTVDDYVSIIHNPHIKSIGGLTHIFSESFFGGASYYRPMVYVSFMVEYHLFGLNSFFFNLTNIILHITCAYLVFLIIDKISKDRWLAYLTSLVFVIHPIHWEAVTNIPGRSIILCAVFFLLSFYYFIRYLEQSSGSSMWYGAAMVAFVVSLLSKESAVILPLVLLLYVWIFRNDFKGRLKTLLFKLIPFFIVLGGYLVLRRLLGITSIFSWNGPSELFLAVTTFLKSCIIHLSIILIPRELYFDRSELLITSMSDPWVAGSWAFWLILLCCFLFILKRRNKVMDFFAWWMILNMVIVSQIFPIIVAPGYISTADHFLYLSSIGLFVILIIFIRIVTAYMRHAKVITSRTARMATIGYFLFLGLLTIVQTVYSGQQIAMYLKTLEHNPSNSRVRNALATAYAHAKVFDKAEVQYALVLKDEPWNIDARIGYGVSLCDQGECAKALKEYDKINGVIKSQKLLDHNRNIAIERLIFLYKLRLVKEPENADLRYSLGAMYSRRERVDEALEQYERALKINPNHANTLYNLASIKDALGQSAAAIDLYKRFLNSDNTDFKLKKHAQKRVREYISVNILK